MTELLIELTIRASALFLLMIAIILVKVVVSKIIRFFSDCGSIFELIKLEQSYIQVMRNERHSSGQGFLELRWLGNDWHS